MLRPTVSGAPLPRARGAREGLYEWRRLADAPAPNGGDTLPLLRLHRRRHRSSSNAPIRSSLPITRSMNRISLAMFTVAAAAFGAAHASAQVSLTPVAGFGSNGWLAPGSTPYLATANNERGMSYNPLTGNLLLVSRTGGLNVRVLNGATGADLGGLDVTGVSGGTFALSMIDVAGDGSIYAANLAVFQTTTNLPQTFTIYRWNDEASGATTPPIVAYTGTPGTRRIGDTFAIQGGAGGSPIQFAAAGGAVLDNGNVSIGSHVTVGTLNFTNTAVMYTNVPGTVSSPNNDYRLGLTWVDADTLIGTQGANGRITTVDPITPAATLDNTIALGGAPRRAMDFAVIGGRPLLAVIDSNTSIVTVLDITNPAAPLAMVSATATVGTPAANVNGTGSVHWGAISGTTARLYAMNSNQGIQAFDFSFGPLAATSTYGVGCDGLGMTNTGLPTVGNAAFSLDVTNVPVFSPLAFVAFGSLAINPGLDLTFLGMPGCFSYTSFDLNLYQTGPVVNQIGSFVLAIPTNTALAGSALAAQGVSLSITTPFGLNTSNGLQFTIGF